jgi:hypothetical protein
MLLNTRKWHGFFLTVLLCLIPASLVLPGIDVGFWFLLHPTGFWEKIVFGIVAIACFWPQFLLACFLFYLVAKIIEEC